MASERSVPIGGQARRKSAVAGFRREFIVEAARRVFERDGLDGASLRGIAAEAGYTAGALYFHFDSKEALYAEVLGRSLQSLQARVDDAVAAADGPAGRFEAAAMTFFDFYAENPRDLDLGFYLLRGGMRPQGLGRERDKALNTALEATLIPIRDAALELGAPQVAARMLMADAFAHAVGVLLMMHTRRIGLFGLSPRTLMQRHVARELTALRG